jgi:hypothetical protein
MEDDLVKLYDELENYKNITDKDKECIINVFKSWKKCKNNNIVISKIDKKTNVRIDNNIIANSKVLHENVNIKSSIHFIGCKNFTIFIDNKINHIYIEKCSNFTIKSVSGLISGIDIINSNNVKLMMTTYDIYNLNIRNSSNCNVYVDDSIVDKLFIYSMKCDNLEFIVVNEAFHISKYLIEKFDDLHYLSFVKNIASKEFELHCCDKVTLNKTVIKKLD